MQTELGHVLVKRLMCPAVALTLMLLAPAPANAIPITFDVAFTATNLVTGAGLDPPPVDPVTGEFTITLDPTVAVTNNTADITLNSLNIALGSSLSFSYSPVVDGALLAGTLRVGGLQVNSDQVQFSPSSNDFWLYITDFATTPTFSQLGYSQTSVSSANLFFTLNQTGSVTAATVSNIPEPSTLAVWLGLGGIGLVAGRWRRRRKAA